MMQQTPDPAIAADAAADAIVPEHVLDPTAHHQGLLSAPSGEDIPIAAPRAGTPSGESESVAAAGIIPLAASGGGSSEDSRRRRKDEKKAKVAAEKARTQKAERKKAEKKKEERARKELQLHHEKLKKSAKKAVRSAGRHFADILGAGGGSLALAQHSAKLSPPPSGVE